MKPILKTLAACVLAAAGTAYAVQVSSFGTPNAGWNVGSGQPADGFNLSTDSESGVQVGLRSQDYQVGVSANNGLLGDYFVAAGERSPGSGLSNWNLDFSIDGAGSELRTFKIDLTIDWDPGAGQDLVSYSIDTQLANSPLTLLQDSQNLGFGFWGHAFDPFATGTYVFSLSIVDKEGGGAQLARSTIRVNVAGQQVPEPASLALVALALAGAGVARRRR